MSELIAFVGDAVMASGYRLAGVATTIPEAGDELAAFEQVLERATVVLVSLDTALRLPAARLERAIAGKAPLVLIVPATDGRDLPIDPAARVRRQLGFES